MSGEVVIGMKSADVGSHTTNEDQMLLCTGGLPSLFKIIINCILYSL